MITLLGYALAVPRPEADQATAARRQAIGTRMREVRKDAGLTQAQVADAAGLSRFFYQEVEGGKRTLSLDNVFAISDALGVSARDFFNELPEPGQGRQSTESAKLSRTTDGLGVQLHLAKGRPTGP